MRLSLLVLWGLLAACTRYESPDLSHNTDANRQRHRQAELTRAKHNLSRDSGVPLRPLLYDVQSYKLNASFDWTEQTLRGRVEINFVALTMPLTEIELDSNVRHIEQVVDARGIPLSFAVLANHKVKISFPVEIPPGAAATVGITYQASANELSDGAPAGLTAVASRAGDPNPSRVVYTTSEPLSAAEWMPCHNDPRDRAHFSVALEMEKNEMAIANGKTVVDDTNLASGKRRMQFATAYPLPTYLMAFAQGEFTQVSEMHGQLPVTLYHRPGIPIQSRAIVKEIVEQIKHYESLLVSYPFEKYSLVLLPEFTASGLEHASVTFQAETHTTIAGLGFDLWLSAHELGHQWFGDLVTIDSWDDLWIKEGMATLLAEEASRKYEDKNRAGRLFGFNFVPIAGEAIRDFALAPDVKYTSGPYDRAAWLLTQIRAITGEKRFWQTLRQVLSERAFSSIGSDDFLAYFKSSMPAPAWDRLEGALGAKALPTISVTTDTAGGRKIAVSDREGALLSPITADFIDFINDKSDVVRQELSDVPRSIAPGEQRLLVIDRLETHPLPALYASPRDSQRLLPFLQPRNSKQQAWFRQQNGGVWLNLLLSGSPRELSPLTFESWLLASPSEKVSFQSLGRYCAAAAEHTKAGSLADWRSPLSAALMARPLYALAPTGAVLAPCQPFLDPEVYASELIEMEQHPSLFSQDEGLLYLLASLPIPTLKSNQAWLAIAGGAASVRSRVIAIEKLLRPLNPYSDFESVSDPEQLELEKMALAAVVTIQSTEILQAYFEGLKYRPSSTVLLAMGKAVAANNRSFFRKYAVCAAHRLAHLGTPPAWSDFLAGTGSITGYSPYIRSVIEDPAKHCPES